MKTIITMVLALMTAFISLANEQLQLKEVASFKENRPTAVAVSQGGRIFANLPYSSYSPDSHTVSVIEILANGTQIPYPNKSWNEKSNNVTNHYLNIQSLVIDSQNDLWVLDTGSPKRRGVVKGGARLIHIDLATNNVLRTVTISNEVLGNQSYLNDLRIDKTQSFAYITDSVDGGILVVNLSTGAQKRVLQNELIATNDTQKTLVIEGITLNDAANFYATDGIAYDPQEEMIYYQYRPFAGSSALMKVDVNVLNDFTLSRNQLKDQVTFVGNTVIADGITYKNGFIYLTDLERNAISRYDLKTKKLETVVANSDISWPDSIAFDAEDNIYFTTAQFHRLPGLNNGVDLQKGDFKIYKTTASTAVEKTEFKLKFAPHIGLTSLEDGMFVNHAGQDPISQIEFIASQGFKGIEDNFMKIRPVAQQIAIAQVLERNGMQLGSFVHNTTTWQDATLVSEPSEVREIILKEIKETVEVAKRVNGKYLTLLSGKSHPTLERQYQKANFIQNLRVIAEEAEKAGLILGLEAINGTEFQGTFITKVTDAYEIVKAVNSPSIKLTFDMYHVQIENGNVINNFDKTFDEITYVHMADNPGRSEPGTGEMNFENILKYIYKSGYKGFIDMEHVSTIPGKEGEQNILTIYKNLNEKL
ncbi:TIM barrel protein [Aquimarina sp. U1-2]|uniref:L-dopachrome tautomerase-related protein n=1 Tax=Aquimarina sp. U1-2 TaxID=2823141 RepID=UPI001AED05C3|nr:L-dopachrome tautomerase-related protein [Aquimarina sp. U1-2]MBP2831047.1 TIM barrel protein [Aquimarina sp. U1-2]